MISRLERERKVMRVKRERKREGGGEIRARKVALKDSICYPMYRQSMDAQ